MGISLREGDRLSSSPKFSRNLIFWNPSLSRRAVVGSPEGIDPPQPETFHSQRSGIYFEFGSFSKESIMNDPKAPVFSVDQHDDFTTIHFRRR